MSSERFHRRAGVGIALLLFAGTSGPARAQTPVILHRQLGVREVASGFTTPTKLAFLGSDDFFVLEKNTGIVKRVTNGTVQGAVLDLAVNFDSERGLLHLLARAPHAGLHRAAFQARLGEQVDNAAIRPARG